MTEKKRQQPIRGPIGCLIGAVALVASFVIAQTVQERRGRQPVLRGAMPAGFPLVVFARESPGAKPVAHLVSAEHLDRFRAQFPDHSFLMPEPAEAGLFDGLKSPDRRFTEGQFVESFNAQRLPSGRQLITVDAPWSTDGFNVGRYEATDVEIAPRDLRRGGYLQHTIAVTAMTLLGSFATLALAAVAERIWLRRNRALA